MTDSLPKPQPDADQPTAPSPEPPRYESHELFRGARVLEITHSGEKYRLLITRNNRLILQK